MNDRDITTAWLTNPTSNDQTSQPLSELNRKSLLVVKPNKAMAKNVAAMNSSGRPKKNSG